MENLETLFSTFENAEPVHQFVEWAFPYLSEPVRARMPHYLAWYILVAMVCLVISVVARRRNGESLSRGCQCAVLTAFAVAFALGSAWFSFEDPLRHLVWSLDGLRILLGSAVAHVTSLQPLGLLGDVVNVAILVISVIFWGALAGIPVFALLLAMRAEAEVYWLAAPIALVGHSLFCMLVIAICMTIYALARSVFLALAVPIGLIIVVVMAPMLSSD